MVMMGMMIVVVVVVDGRGCFLDEWPSQCFVMGMNE